MQNITLLFHIIIKYPDYLGRLNIRNIIQMLLTDITVQSLNLAGAVIIYH